jgi:transposase-like protein
MSTGKRRVFTRDVKLSAIQRVLAGESGAAVCRELKIRRSHLSLWCAQYRRHGPEGPRLARRPLKVHGEVEWPANI